MQSSMTVRICSTCQEPLKFNFDGTQEGIYCEDEYYHEGDCINKSFEGTGTTWEEHYTEDGDCYFTEWGVELLEHGQWVCPNYGNRSALPNEEGNCSLCDAVMVGGYPEKEAND